MGSHSLRRVKGKSGLASRMHSLAQLRKWPNDETLTSYDRPVLVPADETLLKKVRVNEQEYCWNVRTLGSLIDKWKDQFFNAEYKKVDTRWWRVVVNHRCIPAQDFSSVPISDGDEISIVMGRASTHRVKCHE